VGVVAFVLFIFMP